LARVTDPSLVNPWGIAYSPTGPFWFAENGSGVSDLLDGRGEPFSLVVAVPSAGHSGSAPTGTVFNGGTGFVISENGVSAPSRFLFVSQDGTISGWSAVVDPARALPVINNSSSGAVYTGLALAADPAGHSFLYAADFSGGTIEVFDQDFRPVMRSGSFQDPSLPEDFAPFNVQNINNLLFVTYAQQDEDQRDDIAGAGHGFVDVYDATGTLVRRFASQGALNSPWGLALAPADFGPLGGALLVGNNGDGHINAYDPGSGAFLGELADDRGTPIAIPNLWALTFGNGHAGGDSDTLFFAAGVDYDAHGLFGAIQVAERRGADTAGAGTFDPNAPGESGDYPLPPRDGPAFRASSEEQPILLANLLPLTESSLVLVPTLSTTSQPITGIDAPFTVDPIVVVASSRSTFAGVPAPNTVIFIRAGGNSRPAKDAYTSAVALNTFIDLNAPLNVPQSAGAARPDTYANLVGARRLPSANRNAGVGGPSFEKYARLETQSSDERGLGALPPSEQADKVLAGALSQGRDTLAGERADSNESVETQNRDDWTRLINGLIVRSVPILWTCWAVMLAIPPVRNLCRRNRSHVSFREY
jgi:uncharacterized protein (TIGR03118 family)